MQNGGEKHHSEIPENRYNSLQAEYNDLFARYEQVAPQLTELQKENVKLKEELAWLKRQIFGRKSERHEGSGDDSQLKLDLDDIEAPQEKEPEKQTITIERSKTKKKGHSRTELPSYLRREEETIDPSADLNKAKNIGEEVTEILEYEPGELYVRKIVRPKYITGEGIVIGDMPALPIPKGNVGPGLLSKILIDKFADHLPFYRQAAKFEREGLRIAESTINDWFRAGCNLLEPLYKELIRKVQNSDYIQADETPIDVLDANKKKETHKGYHWVYYSPLEKTVAFRYRKGRGREGPKEFLKNFEGWLQTDGYKAYNKIKDGKQIRLLACMAHARRKFEHALENDQERAEYALGMIRKLYAVERKAREENLSFEERKALREQESMPVFNTFGKWLKSEMSEVLPKSSISKAFSYSLNLWERLGKYFEDGRFEIDNNWVENSIRPVAIGRKNYLFAGSHDAGQRAAMLYSFLGTCNKNNVEPFAWIKDVLSRIPEQPVNRLEELLPANWKVSKEGV